MPLPLPLPSCPAAVLALAAGGGADDDDGAEDDDDDEDVDVLAPPASRVVNTKKRSAIMTVGGVHRDQKEIVSRVPGLSALS